jgi:hypothetical protein
MQNDLPSIFTNSAKTLDLRLVNPTKADLLKLHSHIKETGFKADIIWGNIPPRCKKLIKNIELSIKNNITPKALYPDVFTHILFSLHVYEDISPHDAEVKFASDKRYDQYLNGWKILEIFDEPISGYYGVIYQNTTYKQFVLAHRGTQIEGENIMQKLTGLFCNKDSDLQTDIRGIFGKNLVAQQVQAYEFTQKAVNYAKEQSYHLSITGHSLGAWLSEMSGYYCYRDFNYPEVKIINFDSPGSVAHMSDFEVNIKNCETEFDIKNIDITTYLSAPNLVNCCNQHMGKVYRLFPEIFNLNNIDQTYLKWLYRIPILGQKLKDNDFILEGLLSLSGHSLKKLVESFNEQTGKPIKYMKVLHWPTIHYTPKQNITDLVIDNIAKNIPTSILSSCFKKIAKGIVHHYTYSTAITSTINVIGHFLNGEIDLKQYLSIYKNSITNNENFSSEHTINGDHFSLLYKNHYHVTEIDHYKEIINTSNKGSIEWYLARLSKYSEKKIRRNFHKLYASSLILLKKQYKIIAQHGKKYMVSTHQDYPIPDIKDKMEYLIYHDEQVKELLQQN